MRSKRDVWDVSCDGLVAVDFIGTLGHCPAKVTVTDRNDVPPCWRVIEEPVMHFCPDCANSARVAK